MSIASNSPDHTHHRPVYVDIGRRFSGVTAYSSPPTLDGVRSPARPAIVMRGWWPRAIDLATPERSLWSLLSSVVLTVVKSLAEGQECARARQDLLRLDDHALRDIGMTRLDVRRHLNKPFWRG
jgi:uncharacterized protein YjiS (DUF1127 family)